MLGFIYIMSNPAHPGLLKIGQTSKDPLVRRKELSTTGVPEEFVIEYQALVSDYRRQEKYIHQKLSKVRHSDKKEFFETARSFPLGINRLTGDRIVRVAMGTDDDYTLICTGDVNENAYVQILHADNAQLVSAAKEASQLSHNAQYQKSFKLYIGCLARLLVMGENFYKELDAIYEDEELLVGALSVGEIANNKDHYLELYNSTAVVAKIADA